jgi:Glycosyltransferase family 87
MEADGVIAQEEAPVSGSTVAEFQFATSETLFTYLGAAVLVFAAVLWTANGPRLEKVDFSVTYLGARIVHEGRGAQLYDLDQQIKLRSSLYRDPNPLIYEHPPFEALLLSPLAGLPYKTAYLIWGFLNALIWLALPFLLRPFAPLPKQWTAYLALWLIFAPLGVALFQGQSSLILLLCYTLSYIFWRRDQPLIAGVCLGLGLFKFQFVLPFVVILVLRRKWRFVGGFVLIATFWGLLSVAAIGWNGCLSYVKLLLSIGTNPQNVSFGSAVDMPTLHGFVYAVLGDMLQARALSVIVAVVSIFLFTFAARSWGKAERQGRELSEPAFGAAIVASLMIGLHMFTHDFSPLMLSLLIAMAYFPDHSRRALRLCMAACIGLFFFPPSYFVLVATHKMFLMFPLLLIFWWCMTQIAENQRCLRVRDA